VNATLVENKYNAVGKIIIYANALYLFLTNVYLFN
jgi:hypothetical protein